MIFEDSFLFSWSLDIYSFWTVSQSNQVHWRFVKFSKEFFFSRRNSSVFLPHFFVDHHKCHQYFLDSASSCGEKFLEAVFWRINYIYGSTKMTKLLNHSRFPTAQSSPTFWRKNHKRWCRRSYFFFQSTFSCQNSTQKGGPLAAYGSLSFLYT